MTELTTFSKQECFEIAMALHDRMSKLSDIKSDMIERKESDDKVLSVIDNMSVIAKLKFKFSKDIDMLSRLAESLDIEAVTK